MANVYDIAKKYERKYGHEASAGGRFKRVIDTTSTGILSLDYALGTGGWQEGTINEVFGPPDIGKSSIIGFNAIIEQQKKDRICAIVALEPGFDPAWAEKNGVDLDKVIIGWPDNGEEAFNMAYDFVLDENIGFVLFDSIGAVLRPTEAGDKGKPSQGGQSALITWGVKRLQMPAWKRKKTVILLNQVRDDMNSRIPGLVDSPGGHALKHTCEVRVQLRPGSDQYKVRVGSGDDAHDVTVGRQIVAIVKRTKRAEGTGARAVFDFYSMETPDLPFGVDKEWDVINTAKRAGVFTGTGWLYHHSFPDGKLHGKDAVAKFLRENPLLWEGIRNEVLAQVRKNELKDTVEAT